MDGIRVSYILSTKDRCAHLERTLANVREFITPADELIVTDGASTDATAQVVAAFKDIVSTFQSEPDHGEAHGFNKAALMARGRIIKPLTDDDYVYPEAMHRVINALEADDALDAIVAGGEHCHAATAAQTGTPMYYHRLAQDEPLSLVTMTRVGCGLGFVLRRRVLARVGLFNPDFLLADMDYLARMLRVACNVKYMDVKLFRHVSHEHSLYERGVLKRDRDWIRVGLRTGLWPGIANDYSLEAFCLAVGLPPGDRRVVLVRALRDLTWLQSRIGPVAAVFTGLIHVTRTVLQWLGRRLRRGTRARPAPPEPAWDGMLR